MKKRLVTPLATLATVAVLTLTGCSAGTLTGPEMPSPESPAIETTIPGTDGITRGATHNEPGAQTRTGTGTSTIPVAGHNEIGGSR